MSDFVNEFWNWYVILIVLISVIACGVFLWSQSIHHPGGEQTTDTTGHVWDENARTSTTTRCRAGGCGCSTARSSFL
jgi:hypothetical protein